MTSAGLVVRFREFQHPPRVWSPLDAFIYSLMTTNIAVTFGTILVAQAAFYYPLGSLTVAILVAGVFTVAEAVVYALLVPTLPRNGGDYLYQTRLLSRPLGATVSMAGVVVGGALWMAISGWFASRFAVGPFLLLLGTALEWEPLITFGQWVLGPAGIILMGVVVIGWSALLNLWGLRRYARVQRVLLLFGLVSVVLLVVYFSFTTLSINQSGYKAILYRALEMGFERRGRVDGLTAVVRLLPIVAFGLIYPGWVTYQAGEIRKAWSLRVQLLAIVGGKVAGVVFALFFLPLPIHHVGEELFGASAHLAMKDPASFWVLAPRLFATNQSPWLGIVTLASLAVLINVWFWLWAPNHVLAASRVLLAMCWDRILPAWLGRLDPRTGAPRRAIAVFSAISLVACLLALAGGMSRLAIIATVLSLATFAITCLAAGLLPFRARELYRESPASRLELLHLPLITVAAALFVGFAFVLVWQYLRLGLQVQAQLPWTTTVTVAGIFMACLVLTLVLSRRRRLGGAQVRVFYRQEASETTVGVSTEAD